MDADVLQRECAQLDSLARGRPNRVAREHVQAALQSKWEGVQVHAARALASWGDRDSVLALREWLRVCLNKPVGWSVSAQAVACLVQCCTADDANWILDTYFDAAELPLTVRHQLLPLLDVVESNLLSQRIRLESGDRRAARVEAAAVAARRLALRG